VKIYFRFLQKNLTKITKTFTKSDEKIFATTKIEAKIFAKTKIEVNIFAKNENFCKNKNFYEHLYKNFTFWYNHWYFDQTFSQFFGSNFCEI
jgi:hypothetical protein